MPMTEEILRNVTVGEVVPARLEPVAPSSPVSEAVRLLDERGRGAVVVCEDRRVTGIFTERDVLNKIAGEATDLAAPLSQFMTADPTCIGTDALLTLAVSVMIRGGFRNLPIVDDDGREAGMISSQDVLDFIAERCGKFVANLPPRLDQRMMRPEGG